MGRGNWIFQAPLAGKVAFCLASGLEKGYFLVQDYFTSYKHSYAFPGSGVLGLSVFITNTLWFTSEHATGIAEFWDGELTQRLMLSNWRPMQFSHPELSWAHSHPDSCLPREIGTPPAVGH